MLLARAEGFDVVERRRFDFQTPESRRCAGGLLRGSAAMALDCLHQRGLFATDVAAGC